MFISNIAFYGNNTLETLSSLSRIVLFNTTDTTINESVVISGDNIVLNRDEDSTEFNVMPNQGTTFNTADGIELPNGLYNVGLLEDSPDSRLGFFFINDPDQLEITNLIGRLSLVVSTGQSESDIEVLLGLNVIASPQFDEMNRETIVDTRNEVRFDRAVSSETASRLNRGLIRDQEFSDGAVGYIHGKTLYNSNKIYHINRNSGSSYRYDKINNNIASSSFFFSSFPENLSIPLSFGNFRIVWSSNPFEGSLSAGVIAPLFSSGIEYNNIFSIGNNLASFSRVSAVLSSSLPDRIILGSNSVIYGDNLINEDAIIPIPSGYSVYPFHDSDRDFLYYTNNDNDVNDFHRRFHTIFSRLRLNNLRGISFNRPDVSMRTGTNTIETHGAELHLTGYDKGVMELSEVLDDDDNTVYRKFFANDYDHVVVPSNAEMMFSLGNSVVFYRVGTDIKVVDILRKTVNDITLDTRDENIRKYGKRRFLPYDELESNTIMDLIEINSVLYGRITGNNYTIL